MAWLVRKGDALDLSRPARPRRAPVWAAGLALALACLAAARGLPYLRAAAQSRQYARQNAQMERALPGSQRRLARLTGQTRALRAALAAEAGLRAENAALRALVGGGHVDAGLCWRPCRAVSLADAALTAVYDDGGAPPAGAALTDAEGRFAGLVTGTHGQAARAGRPGCTVFCTVGGAQAALCAESGVLWLIGLPRRSGVAAGDTAATLYGCTAGVYVGQVAAPPRPDAGGLTCRVPLTDTAAPGSGLLFAVTAG